MHRNLSRADPHLPKSPNKKAEIIQRLPARKIEVEKRNLLSSDEKEWLVEFLNCSDIIYTNPGRKITYMLVTVKGNVNINKESIYFSLYLLQMVV